MYDYFMEGISGAYQRKEYGWFAATILVVIFGAKLAGIGGSVGGILALEGIYRTLKNQSYSTGKKVLFSLGYTVAGVALAAVIVFAFIFLFQKMGWVTQPSTDAAQQVLNAATTQATVPFAISTDNSNLANAYINTREGFEIRQPKDWTIEEVGTDGLVVQFDDPNQNIFALETVSIDTGLSKYSLQEFAAGAMEGFATASGKDQQVKILSQGPIEINGQSAYKVEYSYLYPMPDGSGKPFHAISVFFKQGDKGYVVFATAQEETWASYKQLMESSLSTFSFL